MQNFLPATFSKSQLEQRMYYSATNPQTHERGPLIRIKESLCAHIAICSPRSPTPSAQPYRCRCSLLDFHQPIGARIPADVQVAHLSALPIDTYVQADSNRRMLVLKVHYALTFAGAPFSRRGRALFECNFTWRSVRCCSHMRANARNYRG
jgi:hypothetical protein